jgi:hypothetical protein
MDRKIPKKQELERLIRLSEAARSCLEKEAFILKQRLDVPTRIRSSLKSHPAGWLAGSLASGLAASLLFRHRPTKSAPPEKKPRSLPLSLLGLTLTAARPLAKVWLTGQLKSYLTGQSATSPAKHHPPSSPH